jgi:type I restriction enzyme S subunit
MDWYPTTFGEILENIVGGGTPSKANSEYWDGDIPWASVKDMKEGRYRLSRTEDYITKEGLNNSATNLIPKGTVITSTRMGLGRVFINDVDMAINQDLKALFPKRSVYNEYLLRLIAANAGLLESLGSGTTVKGVRLEQLMAVNVLLPPLPTQRKIATILSAYDDLIENNLRRIEILEEMAQNLYREWFVKFRFPGHQHARFTDSPLGRIPEGWEVVAFTEIADVLSGGTPKTTVPEYWGGLIPFFTPKDAPESFYVTNTEKAITEIGLSKCNSKLYPRDTVFITARGTVGKVVMPSMDMAMNQSCYALRGKEGISQLYLFLTSRERIDYLKKNTGGATFDTIVVETFRRMLVAKPASQVIVEFSQLIKPGMELILNILKKNNILSRTRDLLLPRLISGEVDVSELDIAVPEEAVC